MSSNIIDLHSHTVCSDGSASPTELVRLAHGAGARAIAITDHDTVAGLAEGRTTAAEFGMEFINGIEISAEYQPGTMHILGYFIDPESRSLGDTLNQLRRAREERNPQIARRLQSLGLDVTYEEVAALAGNEVVGRPHFARVMLNKGYVESIKDAFNSYLAKGAPAYVEKARLSPKASIDLIHDAGGAAVLAHPYQMGLSWADLKGQLGELVEFGLDGIEAIYSRHSAEDRAAYSELAKERGLLVTGGSDFHGSYKPDISIVLGLGDLEIPYELLGPLKERAASYANGRRSH